MGFDARGYARDRQLNWGDDDPIAATEHVYRVSVGRELKAWRWFLLPSALSLLLLSPLILLILTESGVFRLDALSAVDEKVFLPAGSNDHYVFFGAAAVLYLLLACVLFTYRFSTVLLFAIFTSLGCFGSVWLLRMLWAAAANSYPPQTGSAEGFDFNHVLYAIKIGYQSLEHPGGQMRGYILGVGIAEELAKLLPVFVLAICQFSSRVNVIAAFALGVGFGLAEGILYSETRYNGHSPVSAYVVRFVSLVGLHGMWTTIAYGCFSMVKHLPGGRAAINLGFAPQWAIVLLTLGMAPAVALHGYYDTVVGTPGSLQALWVILAGSIIFGFVIYRSRVPVSLGDWRK